MAFTKNTQVSETKEFRRSYFRESESPKKDFKNATFNVWCYRGSVDEPKWKDVDPSTRLISSTYSFFFTETELHCRELHETVYHRSEQPFAVTSHPSEANRRHINILQAGL